MASKFRSVHPRLYVGGFAAHGHDDATRRMRSLEIASDFPTFHVNALLDPAARHESMRTREVTVSGSGYFSATEGLQAAIGDAIGSPAPVTHSMSGGVSGSAATIAHRGVWRQRVIRSSDDEPVMMDANCVLTDPAGARCVFEGQVTGGGSQASPSLSQVTRPIPIRTDATPRLRIISGNRLFRFQVRAADARRYLAEDDYAQFVTGNAQSQITGVYRLDNITILSGVVWADIDAERVPEVDLTTLFAGAGVRNTPDGIIILDTFDGARYACVQVSRVTRQDARTLRVSLQGSPPGSNAFTTIGAAQTAAIGADGLTQGFWFDVPPATRGINAVRVLVEFLLSTNTPGARTDYSAYVRADFAPRVVHH